jgi:hypothetical protein
MKNVSSIRKISADDVASYIKNADLDVLNSIKSLVDSRFDFLNINTIKMLCAGDKVWFENKTSGKLPIGRIDATVVKINRTRASVLVDGHHWTIPIHLLRVR